MGKEIMAVDGEQRQTLINNISWEGASRMMKSAIFGQIIILIVFIPHFIVERSGRKNVPPHGSFVFFCYNRCDDNGADLATSSLFTLSET